MRKMIVLAFTCFATAAAAQIYTWKDVNGVTHYSDQPPAGKTTSVKELPVPPAPPPQAKETVAREKPVDLKVKERAEKEEAAAQKKQANCQKATADLQAFENSPRHTSAKVVTGKNGKKSTVFNAVDGEDRSMQDTALRKAVDEACK